MSSKNRIKKTHVWLRTSATSLGFFSYGYTIGIFNSSLSCISSILDWKSNSQLLISIMSAMVLLGGCFGSALSGCMSQYFGKRKNIITTDMIMIIGSILCSYPNTISFGIGRFYVVLLQDAFQCCALATLMSLLQLVCLPVWEV